MTLLCAALAAGAAQATPPAPSRYETGRATLDFEPGQLTPEQMARFVALADRGIADVAGYLGVDDPAPDGSRRRIAFKIGSSVALSRAFRGTIFLPAERVRTDSAPYLHETTHVLLPARCRCAWLEEGFASYVQAYVSENLGGYDGVVFSRGGNPRVDGLARRYLAVAAGRKVLPYVGAGAAPPRLESDRWGVAAPFYVLSHSFVKFLVESLGLEPLKRMHRAADPAAELERSSGRALDGWRAAWLAHVGAAG